MLEATGLEGISYHRAWNLGDGGPMIEFCLVQSLSLVGTQWGREIPSFLWGSLYVVV